LSKPSKDPTVSRFCLFPGEKSGGEYYMDITTAQEDSSLP
jgi:hypothetical protein